MAFQLPEGIDKILTPEVHQQLVGIHTDKTISGLERRRKMDDLMRKVPKEVRDKIPLPPHLSKLPADVQGELRKIFFDDSLSFEDKAEKGRLYIKNLPDDTRKLIAPPGFEHVPEATRKQFKEIMDKDGLTLEQRHAEFAKLLNDLPADIKAKVPGIEMWN